MNGGIIPFMEVDRKCQEHRSYQGTAIDENALVHERSCGAIVFRAIDGEDRVLLVQHRPGHWSFPKGHMEPGETKKETAIREVLEETGIHVAISSDFARSSTYAPRPGIFKTVTFFLGDYLDGTPIPQLSEVKKAEWISLEAAKELLIFDRDLAIFREAIECAGLKRQKPA